MSDCMELRDNKTQRAVAEGTIVMYSTTWCSDCRRAKRVFTSLEVPYTEINIEEDPDAARYVLCVNDGMRSVPTIVFPDGSLLVEPGNAELEEKVRALTSSR
jgi:mycoredoxin